MRKVIQPGGFSVRGILRGLLRIRHLKQFVSIGLSVCFLLWIIRIMTFRTFCWIVFSGIVTIAGLSIIEKKCQTNRETAEDHERLLELPFSQKEQNDVRYDLRPYRSSEIPDQPGICGICLKTIKEGSESAHLQCMHAFHVECIQKWLKVQSTCPMCMTTLV